MEKIYVGKLTMTDTVSNADVAVKTELRFENGERHFDEPFKLLQEYYVVEKSELDAYMARKESLELMNVTPIWDAYNRLKAKVNELESENGYLTRINEDFFKERSKLVEENEALKERNTKLKCMVDKFYGMTSAGEELRAANEKLKAEVADLNERINHLEVVLDFLDNKHAGLIIENNKLRGTNNELNAVIVQLRDNAQKAGYL